MNSRRCLRCKGSSRKDASPHAPEGSCVYCEGTGVITLLTPEEYRWLEEIRTAFNGEWVHGIT